VRLSRREDTTDLQTEAPPGRETAVEAGTLKVAGIVMVVATIEGVTHRTEKVE